MTAQPAPHRNSESQELRVKTLREEVLSAHADVEGGVSRAREREALHTADAAAEAASLHEFDVWARLLHKLQRRCEREKDAIDAVNDTDNVWLRSQLLVQLDKVSSDIAVAFERIEYGRTLAWSSRIQANRVFLASMREEAREEEAVLAAATAKAEQNAAVLGLRDVTAPGTALADTPTLGSLKAKLAALESASSPEKAAAATAESDAAGVAASAPNAESGSESVDEWNLRVGTATERERATHEHVLDLQMQFRALGGGDASLSATANHSPSVTSPTTLNAGLPPVHDAPESALRHDDRRAPSSVLGRATREIAFMPCIPPVPPLEAPTPQSNAALAATLRVIGVANSKENFQGHVKHSQKIAASLKLCAGVEFVTVAAHRYCLGAPSGGDTHLASDAPPPPATLLPVTGSVDRSARLDGRSQHWLLSDASRALEGIQYVGGPPHAMHVSRPRTVDVPAYAVQAAPMTAGQYTALRKDRRFRAKLPEVSPSFLVRNHVAASFLSGAASDVVLEPRTTVVDDAAPLEVPYFLAEKIAEALGCVVCPFDVHEAGTRGAESHLFLLDEAALRDPAVNLRRVPWRAAVDDGTRLVDGVSTVVDAAALPQRRSAYGLTGVIRDGAEWNSMIDVALPDDEGGEVPRLPLLAGTGDGAPADDAASVSPARSDGAVTPGAGVGTVSSLAGEPDARLPDGLEYKPRTHALRSGSDYGTQTEHVKPLGDRDPHEVAAAAGFVGPSLATFGLPNRSGPALAAFRLALPCLPNDALALEAELARRDRRRGSGLAFSDIVDCFQLPVRAWTAKFSDLTADETAKDPLYGTRTHRQLAAGFDVEFDAGVPHPLRSISFHAPPAYVVRPGHPVASVHPVEVNGYGHVLRTDHSGPLLLPGDDAADAATGFTAWRTGLLVQCAAAEAAHAKVVAQHAEHGTHPPPLRPKVLVDGTGELVFEDTISRPEGVATLPGVATILHVRVECVRSSFGVGRVQVEWLDTEIVHDDPAMSVSSRR